MRGRKGSVRLPLGKDLTQMHPTPSPWVAALTQRSPRLLLSRWWSDAPWRPGRISGAHGRSGKRFGKRRFQPSARSRKWLLVRCPGQEVALGQWVRDGTRARRQGHPVPVKVHTRNLGSSSSFLFVKTRLSLELAGLVA